MQQTSTGACPAQALNATTACTGLNCTLSIDSFSCLYSFVAAGPSTAPGMHDLHHCELLAKTLCTLLCCRALPANSSEQHLRLHHRQSQAGTTSLPLLLHSRPAVEMAVAGRTMTPAQPRRQATRLGISWSLLLLPRRLALVGTQANPLGKHLLLLLMGHQLQQAHTQMTVLGGHLLPWRSSGSSRGPRRPLSPTHGASSSGWRLAPCMSRTTRPSPASLLAAAAGRQGSLPALLSKAGMQRGRLLLLQLGQPPVHGRMGSQLMLHPRRVPGTQRSLRELLVHPRLPHTSWQDLLLLVLMSAAGTPPSSHSRPPSLLPSAGGRMSSCLLPVVAAGMSLLPRWLLLSQRSDSPSRQPLLLAPGMSLLPRWLLLSQRSDSPSRQPLRMAPGISLLPRWLLLGQRSDNPTRQPLLVAAGTSLLPNLLLLSYRSGNPSRQTLLVAAGMSQLLSTWPIWLLVTAGN